ncbi:nicotinamide-nucleotide amidase [Sphingomonas laterariae]|uniref:Nicotinamide-nucleotide amidase n=1 Tax=Edaphosphingomonas laterariae TaxID=861865 RepID=A0A239JTG3_9SPHN|nr:CinA family protein [Sphingomonas laterariae]SNT08862.1 nicotinamide-nucleotide amidase [Sphingomonas laterariae]
MTETLAPALPDDVDGLVHAVLAAAAEHGLSIATAESCTGGLLASLLTDVEGFGRQFERGFVCYSEEAKEEQLAVAPDVIRRCGAVSGQVAVAMAEGALAASRADIAIAITGFAGPAGPGDEEGLVHFACLRRGHPTHQHEAHFGPVGRGAIRLASLRIALDMLAGAIRLTPG